MEAKIDIEKVRKGDHAAFKTFFECFYPKLRHCPEFCVNENRIQL